MFNPPNGYNTNHQEDRAYDNVILPCGVGRRSTCFSKTGERMPCLELKKRIPSKLSSEYLKLLNNEYWIPCQHQFHLVNVMSRNLWLDRLMVERLEEKTTTMLQRLEQNKKQLGNYFLSISGAQLWCKSKC